MVLDREFAFGMCRDHCKSSGRGLNMPTRRQRQLFVSVGLLLRAPVDCYCIQYSCHVPYVVKPEGKGETGRECAPHEFLQCRFESSAGKAPSEGEGTKCLDSMFVLSDSVLHDLGVSYCSSSEAEYIGNSQFWAVTLRWYLSAIAGLLQRVGLFETALPTIQKEESREEIHHILRWSEKYIHRACWRGRGGFQRGSVQ